MFNFFKPKKTYKVVYETVYRTRYVEIVEAKSVAKAWKKVCEMNWFQRISCVSVEEIK